MILNPKSCMDGAWKKIITIHQLQIKWATVEWTHLEGCQTSLPGIKDMIILWYFPEFPNKNIDFSPKMRTTKFKFYIGSCNFQFFLQNSGWWKDLFWERRKFIFSVTTKNLQFHISLSTFVEKMGAPHVFFLKVFNKFEISRKKMGTRQKVS